MQTHASPVVDLSSLVEASNTLGCAQFLSNFSLQATSELSHLVVDVPRVDNVDSSAANLLRVWCSHSPSEQIVPSTLSECFSALKAPRSRVSLSSAMTIAWTLARQNTVEVPLSDLYKRLAMWLQQVLCALPQKQEPLQRF